MYWEKIKALCARKDKLPHSDQNISHKDIEEWKRSTVTEKKRWILVSQPFITWYLKHKKIQERKQHEDIRRFMSNSPVTKIPQIRDQTWEIKAKLKKKEKKRKQKNGKRASGRYKETVCKMEGRERGR